MPKKPTYFAYSAVPQGESPPEAGWREIGVAFDGLKGSVTILVDAVPVSGKIVLLPPKEADGENAADSLD